MFCFCRLKITADRETQGNPDVCYSKTSSVILAFLFNWDCLKIFNTFNLKKNQHPVVGIIWSNTQERAKSEHSNPRGQPSQLHPVTREPRGPVIPVTTILGTSRMVPNDAVLRWPRLYWGLAAKTHTYTHTRTAANTTSMQMQTNTDRGPTAGLELRAKHMQSVQCSCKGSMHPVIPDTVELYRIEHRQPLHYFFQHKQQQAFGSNSVWIKRSIIQCNNRGCWCSMYRNSSLLKLN